MSKDKQTDYYFNPHPLPSREEICKKNETDGLNPIERFLYDNEPAGEIDSKIFRQQLQHAFTYIIGLI